MPLDPKSQVNVSSSEFRLLRYGSWGEPYALTMVQRSEKEKDSRYIQEASAPAAVPCIRPVTSCTSVTPTISQWSE